MLLRLVPSLAIFDGLEAIQKVSEELLGRLEPIPLASSVAAAEASAEAEALSWTVAALGAALVPRGGAAEHALNRYRPFINTFDASLRTARELLELPSFGGRVRAVAAAIGSTHTLADLLITPIQRPPRYVMLLEAAVAALEKGGGDGRAAARWRCAPRRGGADKCRRSTRRSASATPSLGCAR